MQTQIGRSDTQQLKDMQPVPYKMLNILAGFQLLLQKDGSSVSIEHYFPPKVNVLNNQRYFYQHMNPPFRQLI